MFRFNNQKSKIIESLTVVRRKDVEIAGITVVNIDNLAGAVNEREHHISIRIANNVDSTDRAWTRQFIIDPEEIKIHKSACGFSRKVKQPKTIAHEVR